MEILFLAIFAMLAVGFVGLSIMGAVNLVSRRKNKSRNNGASTLVEESIDIFDDIDLDFD